MAKLFLRLSEGDDDATVACRAGGEPWTQLDWGQVRERARRARVLVLVPSTQLLLASVAMPRMRRRRLVGALPFALEDQLTQDLTQLRFAPTGWHDGRVSVAVVDAQRLQAWQERLARASVEPSCLLADVLALPWSPDTWSVLSAGDRVWVRLDRDAGFAIERECLEPFLVAALRERGAPEEVAVYGAHGDPGHQATLAMIAQRGLSALPRLRDGEALDWLADDLEGPLEPDLRQALPSSSDKPSAALSAWRAAAVLLVLLTGLHLGSLALERSAARTAREELVAQVEAVYRAGFPDLPTEGDLRARAEAQLAALERGGRGQDFLALLSHTALGLDQIRGWEIRALDFRAERLEVELSVPDVSALDALERVLAGDPELQVDVVDASAGQGSAQGTLRIFARRPVSEPSG